MSVVKDVRSRETAVVATKTHEMPRPGKHQDLTACVPSRRARSGEKSRTEMWTMAFLLAWLTFISAAHFPSSSRLFPTSGHCDPSLGSLHSHPSAVQRRRNPFRKSEAHENQQEGEQKEEAYVSSPASFHIISFEPRFQVCLPDLLSGT